MIPGWLGWEWAVPVVLLIFGGVLKWRFRHLREMEREIYRELRRREIRRLRELERMVARAQDLNGRI